MAKRLIPVPCPCCGSGVPAKNTCKHLADTPWLVPIPPTGPSAAAHILSHCRALRGPQRGHMGRAFSLGLNKIQSPLTTEPSHSPELKASLRWTSRTDRSQPQGRWSQVSPALIPDESSSTITESPWQSWRRDPAHPKPTLTLGLLKPLPAEPLPAELAQPKHCRI